MHEFTLEKTLRESESVRHLFPSVDDAKAFQSANALALHEQRQRRKQQLTGMLDRTVEDLILSSMATGQFNNLKGSGQPLKHDVNNPYLDSTEVQINKILHRNGFARSACSFAPSICFFRFMPPWIMKENEVRLNIEQFRRTICMELAQLLIDTHYEGLLLSLILSASVRNHRRRKRSARDKRGASCERIKLDSSKSDARRSFANSKHAHPRLQSNCHLHSAPIHGVGDAARNRKSASADYGRFSEFCIFDGSYSALARSKTTRCRVRFI